jgi:hypothetical protein
MGGSRWRHARSRSRSFFELSGGGFCSRRVGDQHCNRQRRRCCWASSSTASFRPERARPSESLRCGTIQRSVSPSRPRRLWSNASLTCSCSCCCCSLLRLGFRRSGRGAVVPGQTASCCMHGRGRFRRALGRASGLRFRTVLSKQTEPRSLVGRQDRRANARLARFACVRLVRRYRERGRGTLI